MNNDRFTAVIPKTLKDFAVKEAEEHGINLTDFTVWLLTDYSEHIENNGIKEFTKHLIMYKEKPNEQRRLEFNISTQNKTLIKNCAAQCSTSIKNITIAALKYYKYKKEEHSKEEIKTGDIELN